MTDEPAASWDDFERLRLHVGRVLEVEDFPQARAPAYRLLLDFGPLGTRRSSAQLTQYAREELVGRQIVAVLGLPPKRIAGWRSEVLVLGALDAAHGVVLLAPDREVEPGSPVA